MPGSTKNPVEELAQPPGREDRRAWVRFGSERKGSCQPVALPTADEPEERWGAQVRDVSVGGLCLYLRRRFEVGTPLVVDVPEVGGKQLTVNARVARVAAEANGWLVGCQLDFPLKEEELKALL